MKLTCSDKPSQKAGARLVTVLVRTFIAGILLAAIAAFVFWMAQGR
jgi:hypothetical protein